MSTGFSKKRFPWAWALHPFPENIRGPLSTAGGARQTRGTQVSTQNQEKGRDKMFSKHKKKARRKQASCARKKQARKKKKKQETRDKRQKRRY